MDRGKGTSFDEDEDDPDDLFFERGLADSTSTKKPKFKFNMFDDEVSIDEIKKITIAWHDESDDEPEVINWDGTPVTAISYHSSSSQEKPLPLPITANSATLPVGSKPLSFDNQNSSRPSLTHNRSQSLTNRKFGDIGSSPARRDYVASKELSIEEVVGTINRRNPTTADIVKLEEEILTLRKSLQSSRRDRWSPLPVDETIRRLILGEPYSLDMYRSKADKLALLDKAIDVQDGNAIIAVVLFLKSTVKSSLFNLELSKRPVAVNHYISYLKAHFDFTELADTLGMLGRTDEVAMLKYKQAISVVDPDVKIKNLQNCLQAHFKLEPYLCHENALVHEHISLLERQRPIEDSDVKTEKEGKTQAFRQYPRVASIINMPLITTLYYCSFYHYELAENHLASPMAIKKQHQITDKQFLWTVLSARARLKRWLDIEGLLTTKGWFGGAKLKAAIGFDKVVDILNRTGAPLVILSKYLKLVDDADRRLILAKKYSCHDIVIDTYMSLRERAELEVYASKLKPRSPEHQYAQDALRNTTIKWKS